MHLHKGARRLTDSDAGAFVKGLVAEVAAAQALGVKGHVDVEIIDDRTGRVVDLLSGDNYVNVAQWEAFAKALQKLAWTYGYQGDASTVTVSDLTNRDPRYIPTLRADHLACWTDSTAEDLDDVYAFGEITAWAHRWEQGSPSTRQGIVVPSLCTLTDDAVSWVWEWTTANGNGTFQSVGWRRLGYSSNSGDAVLRDMPQLSRRLSTGTGYSGDPSLNVSTQTSWTVGPPSSEFQGGTAIYYDSGSGKLYFLLFDTGGVIKLCSTPVTIDARGDYTLGAVTDESAAAFAAGLGGDNVAYATRRIQGITRLGASGDWIAVGWTGDGVTRRPTIRRVTNAGSIIYTNANAATYSVESGFIDVTYDGTDLWVTALNGNAGVPAIHRIDPATGDISATISSVVSVPAYFPALSSTKCVMGVEWDAANGWLWVTRSDGYLFNMDTSGNWLGVLFHDTTNQYPISSAFLSGQHNSQRASSLNMMDTDDVALQLGVAGGSVFARAEDWPYGQSVPQGWTSGLNTAQGFRSRLVTIDGDVWAQPNAFTFSTGTPAGIAKLALVSFTELPHFATRTLLDSPAVKSNTQTMRIRYTMTFT